MWTFDPTLPQVVRDAWSKPITFETQAQYPKTLRKFSTLRNDLRKWNQLHFGNVIHTSKKLLEELDHLSNLPITDENTLKLREIFKSLEELRVKEESYWKHKSRCDKIKLGDHNQKYFHASTMVRRKNHFLARKKDSNDSFFTDSHEVGNSFTEYFEELLYSTNQSPDHNIESLFHPCVDPTDNEFLVAVPDEEDIWSTVKSIGNWIAPGPDGFQAFFYQKYWDVIKPDIVATIQEMLTSRYVPQAMNLTHIALISKIKNPTTHTHYRPISLCNVIFKIYKKMIANRLETILPRIISPFQGAFTPGRLIGDNTGIAFSIFKKFQRLYRRNQGWVALKMDMSKAYDRVEFLTEYL